MATRRVHRGRSQKGSRRQRGGHFWKHGRNDPAATRRPNGPNTGGISPANRTAHGILGLYDKLRGPTKKSSAYYLETMYNYTKEYLNTLYPAEQDSLYEAVKRARDVGIETTSIGDMTEEEINQGYLDIIGYRQTNNGSTATQRATKVQGFIQNKGWHININPNGTRKIRPPKPPPRKIGGGHQEDERREAKAAWEKAGSPPLSERCQAGLGFLRSDCYHNAIKANMQRKSGKGSRHLV